MVVEVIDNGDMSEKIGVSNGTKQGCVLALLLFSIFFALMLMVAFKDCDTGVPIQTATYSISEDCKLEQKSRCK